ncbi:unnamed protein product [Clonostachys byssicola]|uniref:Uncharacterized protein n=1 Tax=Clonostachys byssicola TaxID=160290 RepID=A0A9N9UMP4_9HYPO|nr:unnamed protein product [Clonostachys byssicola]
MTQLECLHNTKQWQDAFPGNGRPYDAANIFINNRRLTQPTIFPNLSYPGLTSNDHSYLAHFTNHVAHILPTSTETIMSVLNGSYLARYAAMAISAANLANLRGTFVYDSPLQIGYSWIPDSRHRFRSLAYAGKALEIATDCRSTDISTLLAAHLMLTFVELELGSFEGLRYYISTVDGLVYNTHSQLLREKHGPEILCGLFDARSVQKFVAGPIGPPSTRELMMNQFWQTLEIRMPIKPDVAQSLGCEMAIILERLCLLTTMQHHLSTPSRMQYIVMKQLSDYLNTLYPTNRNEYISKDQLVSAYQECLGDMTGIREQVLCLPAPPGVPLLSNEGSQYTSVTDLDKIKPISAEENEPLRFDSHRESMVAADYAWCRILCDESIVLGITNPSGGPLSPISPNASHWMDVLVRIARGIDISECSTKNIYRRGICGMLLHSAIRCGTTNTIDVLEDILDRLISNGSAWEDCMFSNTPSVSTVRAVQRQLEQGRSILMVSSLDENVNPRTTIMSNRMVRTLILHGWEADGRTFDETLHLDDFATALGTKS